MKFGHREKGHMKTEAETRVTQLQDKERPEPHKLEGARKDVPLEPLKGVLPSDIVILHSGLLNCERKNFYCFKLPSLWYLIIATQEIEKSWVPE